LSRDTTPKLDFPTNTIGMGVVPSPDKYSKVVETFGTLVEPLLLKVGKTQEGGG